MTGGKNGAVAVTGGSNALAKVGGNCGGSGANRNRGDKVVPAALNSEGGNNAISVARSNDASSNNVIGLQGIYCVVLVYCTWVLVQKQPIFKTLFYMMGP